MSLVSTEWWKRNGQPGELRRVATPRVAMADGTELKVLGRCEGNMRTDDWRCWARFWVAEIEEEAILGMDFLAEHGVLIDVSAQRLRLGTVDGRRIQLVRTAVIAGGEEEEVDAVLGTTQRWRQGSWRGSRRWKINMEFG